MVSATTAMARSINASSFVKNAPDDYRVRDECKKKNSSSSSSSLQTSVMVKQESVFVQTCQSKQVWVRYVSMCAANTNPLPNSHLQNIQRRRRRNRGFQTRQTRGSSSQNVVAARFKASSNQCWVGIKLEPWYMHWY